MATDAARSVLPAALLTNVGVTANARNLAHMISKLLSSGTLEERNLGWKLLREGRKITPTLLKHADPNQHLRETMRRENWQAAHQRKHPLGETARLADHDSDAVKLITEGILYGQLTTDLDEIRAHVSGMENENRLEIIDRKMRNIGDHDAAIREFELPQMTLELLLDYGAYREFRRHRLQSCFPQPMTTGLGYRTPNLIREAGLEGRFREAIESAEYGYRKVAEARMEAAPYLVNPRPPPGAHRPDEPPGGLSRLQAEDIPADPRVAPGDDAAGHAADRGGDAGPLPVAETPGLPGVVAAPPGGGIEKIT